MGKYVVFTGSFNPPTEAHLASLVTAMKEIGAERGCFVPVCDGYLKNKMLKGMQRLALKAETRIEMLEALCEGREGLEVSDYEVRSGNSTHTYKTLLHFKKTHPGEEIYFLNGADKLKNIPHWNNAEELVREIRFILFDRADMDAAQMIEEDALLSKYRDHFTVIPASDDFTDISSSKVREKFLAGDEGYREMLNSRVADILAKVDLSEYPEPTVYDWIDMKLKGGPFDKVAAYKKVYELNKELFKTMDMSAMLKGTIPVYDIDYTLCKESETEYISANDDYDKLVRDLNAKGLNPVIISEPCFFRPCGGYDQGKADTLEEELCRVSTLSQSIYKYGNPKLKCVRESGANEGNLYPFELGGGLYSPHVTFVRHGSKNGYRELLADERVTCDVISICSVDLTANHALGHVGTPYESDYRNLIVGILSFAFSFAIATGHDAIILNANGAGFHLPLPDVANAVNEAVMRHRSALKCVAINDKQTKKYRAEFWDNLSFLKR